MGRIISILWLCSDGFGLKGCSFSLFRPRFPAGIQGGKQGRALRICAKAFEILRDPGLANGEEFGTIETIETIIFAPFPSPDYHRGKWSEGDRIITISITISIIYNIIIINLLYI